MVRDLQEITVEVIQKCNSNCIFCSSLSSYGSTNEIKLEKLIELADFAKSKNAKNINISGGEPLLKEDLIDFIDYCTQIGLSTTIYTSGNVFMEKFLNEVERRGISDENIKFIFNYQSSNPGIFSKLINCNEKALSTINSNIEKCIKANFEVEAHIVPNSLNLDSIYDTSIYLKKLGIRQVSLLRMVFQGRAKNNKSILEIKDDFLLQDVILKIEKNVCDETFKLRVGIPFSNYSNANLSCVAGYKKLIFRYDGVVFPCEAFKEAPNNHLYRLGDINANTLQEIWDRYHIMDELKKLKSDSQANCESCPAQILYSGII